MANSFWRVCHRLHFALTLTRLSCTSWRGDRAIPIRPDVALAEVYAGGSRSDAARIGGVGLQIVRDWVLRFNAEGPDGLLNGKAPGVPSILNDKPAPGVASDRREWSYPSRSWRRALAPYRSGAMG